MGAVIAIFIAIKVASWLDSMEDQLGIMTSMNDEQEATWFFGVVFFIIFLLTFQSCSESIEKAQASKEYFAKVEADQERQREEREYQTLLAKSIDKLKENGYDVGYSIKHNNLILSKRKGYHITKTVVHYDTAIQIASELQCLTLS